MAVYFSSTVQTMLAGHEVRAAIGIRLDFTSGTVRAWVGQGTVTHGGLDWLGLGQFASIDGLQMSPMLSTDPVTMTLSGLDTTLMNEVRNQATEIRNRTCGVYLLMFGSDWKPLDTPYLIEQYIMDKATYTVDGETSTMSVSLVAEPLFASKYVPATSYITNQDQQAKYAGDKIFERMTLMSGRQTVIWSADA